MRISAGQAEKKRGGGAGLIIGISCGVLLVLILIGVILFLVLTRKAEPEEAEEEEQFRTVVTAENAEEIAEEIFSSEGTNIPAYYTVTQNADWTFADDQSATADAYVENDKENETAVYFDLQVDETGEIIYSSPVLEVGAILENFKLDKPLPKGEYECTVIYHLVDDNQKTLTTTNVGVTVRVMN